MKYNLTKKLVAFVLTLTMFVGSMSITSFATTSNTDDIVNVTNGKTFTLRRDYYDLLKSHPLYGTKDYIAYPWDNVFYIWFFNDDLTNVKFSMWYRGTNNFGLYPSKNVSFTEYVYDRDTLEFIKSWDRTINTSNAYNYSYDFIASFNIYTDKNYNTYFYETKNYDEDYNTFEPLESNDAKDFLRFVSGSDSKDIEKKLPEYYNLLIGNIQDPEKELQVKVSFLTYLYYCLDAQLAQSDARIDMGTTYLINWVSDNTDISNVIYSEIKDSLVDSLKETLAQGATIPSMELAGINIVTAVIDYGELFIVSLGSIKAVRTRDEIQYLMAYKKLLEAKAANDDIAIAQAEFTCSLFESNMAFGGDIKGVQKYTGFLFNIEQTLP